MVEVVVEYAESVVLSSILNHAAESPRYNRLISFARFFSHALRSSFLRSRNGSSGILICLFLEQLGDFKVSLKGIITLRILVETRGLSYSY